MAQDPGDARAVRGQPIERVVADLVERKAGDRPVHACLRWRRAARECAQRRFTIERAEQPAGVVHHGERPAMCREQRQCPLERQLRIEPRTSLGDPRRLRIGEAAQRQHAGDVDVFHEAFDIAGRGRGQDLLGGSRLHDGAVLHQHDPAAERDRLVEIVAHEDDGLAQPCLQRHQLLLHVAADQRIEGAERLVHQQDFGIRRQRACQARALLHAARELARPFALPAVETDQLDRLHRGVPPLGGRHPLHLQPELDVRQDRAMRKQCEVLKHHAEGAAAKLAQLTRARRVTSSPLTRMLPRDGSTRRLRQRSIVDLPLPDSPMTTKISPRVTSKLTRFSATTAPVPARISALSSPASSRSSASRSRWPKTRVTLPTSTSGVDGGVDGTADGSGGDGASPRCRQCRGRYAQIDPPDDQHALSDSPSIARNGRAGCRFPPCPVLPFLSVPFNTRGGCMPRGEAREMR